MMPKTQSLPVRLTSEELGMRAVELGKALAEKDDVETEKKVASDRFKERMETLDIRIRANGRIVREGQEYREVPVSYSKNYERGLVETMRMDTGETVDSRPMSEHERQAGLFEKEEAAADAAESAAPAKGSKKTRGVTAHVTVNP